MQNKKSNSTITKDWSDFIGCQGHKEPYLNLEKLLDTSNFEAMHEEICLGLLRVDWSYTGGSHKYMQIVPEEFANDPYKDYMQIIRNNQFQINSSRPNYSSNRTNQTICL